MCTNILSLVLFVVIFTLWENMALIHSKSHGSDRELNSDSVDLRLLTLGPINTAVVAGSPTKLECRSNTSTTGLNWQFTQVGAGATTQLVIQCELNPAYESIYAVEDIGPGECHLIVRNVTVNEAGAYQCSQSQGFDNSLSSQLVVLHSEPVCAYSDTSDVADNDTLTISCEISYTSNVSPMVVSWTDPEGQPVHPVIEDTSPSFTRSVIEVTAKAPTVLSYNAIVYFSTPPNLPTTATNTPDYVFNWTSKEVSVQYCPSSGGLFVNTTNTGRYAQGDVLICFSDGYPTPQYVWTVSDSDTPVSQGDTLVLSEQGNYTIQCTATVVIRGTPCSVSVELNAVVVSAPIIPRNTVAAVASSTVLHCQFGNVPLAWSFVSVSSLQPIIIATDCTVVDLLKQYFEVDTADGACNLVIRDVLMYHAGLYTCQEVVLLDRPSLAQLIVIESDPICTVNSSTGTILDGEFLRITCDAIYAGNLVPQFVWTTPNNSTIVNATFFANSTHASSYIDMPAYPALMTSFTCRTYFNGPPPPTPPFLTEPDLNPPAFTSVYNSPALNVIYCPRTVLITPVVNSVVFVGDIFSCVSDGYPEPTYLWTNLVTEEITTIGQNITVTSQGLFHYSCTARNYAAVAGCDVTASVASSSVVASIPLNLAELAGESVALSCRHRSQNIAWLFSPAGTSSSVLIAANCVSLPGIGDNYHIDTSDFSCDLIIDQLTAGHAGTYTCQELSSSDPPASSEIVTLDFTPVCSSNATDSLVARDLVVITCWVSYTGNIVPEMKWLNEEDEPINSENITTSSRVESSIRIRAVYPYLPSYTCITYFNPPIQTPPVHIIPATNAPVYSSNWTSNSTSVDAFTGTDLFMTETTATEDLKSTAFTTDSWTTDIAVNDTEFCNTMIQQNLGETPFFNKSWSELLVEQGDQSGYYWIGLETMHQMTKGGKYKLRLDVISTNGTIFWEEYNRFIVHNSSTNYALEVRDVIGNTGPLGCLTQENNHANSSFLTQFTTYDFDNSIGGCSSYIPGGYWYLNPCYITCLNCDKASYRYLLWTRELSYVELQKVTMRLVC